MPSRTEVLGTGAIRRQKSLGMTGGFESLHTILALARGAMRVFAPVIEVATLAMLHPGQELPLRRAVAFERSCTSPLRIIVSPRKPGRSIYRAL
jgi:hypothetical protein